MKPLDHRRREPAPGVFRIILPLPFPGLDRVNAYVLKSEDEVVLVDVGLYFPDEEHDHGWDHLVEALATCEVRPEDVTRLILTHTHIDHYGMAGRLKEESGCELWIHHEGDDELDILRDPSKHAAELRETYSDHGVPADQLEELTRFEDWTRFVHSVVDADRWLQGDEEFSVGERSWRCVYTPGHSRSHLCFWSDEESLLISGDHLLPTITPHIDFRRGEDDPLGQFLDSLEKVERLDPKIVLPGHGSPFAEGSERARTNVRHHERRLGAIVQVVRREACSASRITEAIFGSRLLNFERRLALGEALAHLAYLRQRGEIERFRDDDGTLLYKKAARRRPPEIEE